MKRKIYFFLIAFNFYFCLTGFSQNCDSIEEWNDIIEREFPDLNTSRLRSGSEVSNRILFNLYSDKYFIDFANKSFEKFNSVWGTSKWKKLRNCRSKKKYESLEHIGWLNQFALEPLWNKRVTDKVMANIIELNETRKEYNQVLTKLRSDNVSFNELITYKTMETNEFRMLMPSEIELFLSLVEDKEITISNVTLLASAREYANEKIDVNNLQKLNNFQQNNSLVYNRADEATRNNANEIVNDKIKIFLDTLIPIEQSKLSQIQSLDKVESYYLNFNRYFSDFVTFSNVQELKNDILDKKTSIVVSQSDAIQSQITQSSNLEELNAIESNYLSRVNDKQETIVSLKESLKSKEDFIKKREREIALNNERKDNALREFASQRIAEIKNLRQQLKVKYESNLPTIEELQNILVDYVNTMNNDGTYEVRRAENMISYIEKFGYMRINDENLSVYESFKNSKGYRIVAGTLDKEDKNLRTWSRLIIPNAPQDIIELYWLELTSDYHDNSKSVFQFRDEFEQFYNTGKVTANKPLKNSGYYVNNGRVLYRMEIEENGDLEVNVYNNFDGTYPVMTEKINDNLLIVSSWSRITDIYLNKGEKIKFSASGKIGLGVFSATPSGLKGWEPFSYVKNLQHASLIGKIGDGSWFEIGSEKEITANYSGMLQLRINETHVDNNDNGEWDVYFKIIK